MTTFYELLPDGTIGQSTPSEKVAQSLGLTLSTEQVIVYGYNGKRYFKGEEPLPPKLTCAEQRATAYPSDVEQLDMLYHDIDSGLLGAAAKNSSFYLARKSIKNEFPKAEKNG